METITSKKLFLAAEFILLIFILNGGFKLIAQEKKGSLAFKQNRVSPQLLIFKPYDAAYQLYSGFVLVQKANAGDPFAQHELGLRYLTGEGFQQDTNKSFFWIQKAAEQKLPAALYNLGIFFNNGWAVEWNPFEAFKNILNAAKQDMPQAQYFVGLTFTENLIMPRNLFAAYGWIKKSANLGFEPAKETLLEFEKRGITSEIDSTSIQNKNGKDKKNSKSGLQLIDFTADTSTSVNDSTLIEEVIKGSGKFFQEDAGIKDLSDFTKISDSSRLSKLYSSANCGSPEALTLLGKIYELGITVNKNLILAASFYARAIVLESPRASKQLWELVQQKNFVPILKDGIAQNNDEAKFVLALLAALKFDNLTNEQEIIKLLNDAVSKNNVNSINYLGLCCYTGNNIKKNKYQAKKLWESAASLGNDEAAARLIMINIADKSTNKSDINILKSLEEQGSILAQFSLAYCFENGFGIKKNMGEAVHYYRKAAFRGSVGAYESLKKIYDELRPSEKEFQLK